MKTNYSNFWDSSYNSSVIDDFLGLTEIKKGKDLIALAGYRRAISNFVNIVTGKSIPVKFQNKDSYTDGKTVTIGANLNDKNFDVAVGLALHEGSHIKLSDFQFLSELINHITPDIYDLGWEKGYRKHDVLTHVKTLLNIIEDRRVDFHIFSTSPGYKGYYHSMYDKHFNNKVIDKALKANEYRDENWTSYEFRIINLHNKNRDLNALGGLVEIWKAIDLKNISRLKSSTHAFSVAIEVYKIILNNLENGIKTVDKDTGEVTTEPAGSDSKTNNENGTTINTGDAKMTPDGDVTNSASDVEELSDRQKSLLEKAVNKQKSFVNDNVKKTNLSKKDSQSINTLESSGATYEEVNVDGRWGGKEKVKTLVVRELTSALIESNQFNVVRKHNSYSYDNYSEYNFVEEGIRLGTILGRKLKVRGEERDLKYTRKNSGKIDRRIIAELGFNNENVFSQTFVEKFNKAYLHLSIDASGSMNGAYWNKAMTSAVAMIRAAEMAGNIHVVVTVRTTHSNDRGYNSSVPLIMVVYDSRKDKINKVKSLFKYIAPNGTTPEGLTFEAIRKELIPGGRNADSYFVNFSDGMPMFHDSNIDYTGNTALTHTKKSVEEIRKNGIRVLSYFISDSDYNRESRVRDFKRMYGSDARFINPTNMMEVAKTMNAVFLEK
tara:strand:+ start:477 stop:2462 length:1986 start_codon:yes stop_codon:yes gene_type:complete